MYSKLSTQWTSFPNNQENIDQLRSTLLSLLQHIAVAPPFVVSKYCQALSLFMILSFEGLPEFIPLVVSSVENRIQQSTDTRLKEGLQLAMLEFLSVLVEQVQRQELSKDKR